MTAKLAAKYTTAIARMQDRREAGASGLEYAGMVLVAAVIVTAIFGVVNDYQIGEKVKTQLDRIFTGS